jgi:hypothetical protein
LNYEEREKGKGKGFIDNLNFVFVIDSAEI